ncbi:hypothetical protein [Nocardia sp. NPDC049707]|uniref:hypothetical protein n=1 Tax=Nocardia sp. NPDC049707 TaxID=3154735 RepID=UPI00342D9017
MSRPARLHVHSAVSTALALHSDHALRELVDVAAPLGAGIGGKSALLEVAGTPVFVKRVPLTDLERQPEHVRSTANLFDLPLFYHYGVGLTGGAGFRHAPIAAAMSTFTRAFQQESRSTPYPGEEIRRLLDGRAIRSPDVR